MQVFTTGGTYTPVANIAFAIVECVGGGGAGGGAVGAAAQCNSAGGGGAGSYSRVRLTAAQIGSSQTVTIGAGGTAGATGNNPGGNGGDTSLGTLCVGKGGTGGPGQANLTAGPGGAGGVSGTGDFKAIGNAGESSTITSVVTTVCKPPQGGASYFGGIVSGNEAGAASCINYGTPNGFGNGGGGARCYNVSASGSGASGSSGVVIVTEYK